MAKIASGEKGTGGCPIIVILSPKGEESKMYLDGKPRPFASLRVTKVDYRVERVRSPQFTNRGKGRFQNQAQACP